MTLASDRCLLAANQHTCNSVGLSDSTKTEHGRSDKRIGPLDGPTPRTPHCPFLNSSPGPSQPALHLPNIQVILPVRRVELVSEPFMTPMVQRPVRTEPTGVCADIDKTTSQDIPPTQSISWQYSIPHKTITIRVLHQ